MGRRQVKTPLGISCSLGLLGLRACRAAAGVGTASRARSPKLFWTMPHSRWGPVSPLALSPQGRVGLPPSVGAQKYFWNERAPWRSPLTPTLPA